MRGAELPQITSLSDDARIAFDNLTEFASNLFSPTLRFGVTGLSRSGKTVFITSLVHNLIHGGRLPLFDAANSGRISAAALQPQPSMNIPRFAYEDHRNALIEDRIWPTSTRAVSELRLTIKYESATGWGKTFKAGSLNLDIVDYPGEWLLDLPLLGLSFDQWSQKTLQLSNRKPRKELAKDWHALLKGTQPDQPADEMVAIKHAQKFTDYLRLCRAEKTFMSSLPPGRFLMPGDLEGSPALTFAPLDVAENASPRPGSLHALMQSRYEAYKSIVVKPFFREHFARIDRQIVLIDVLQAINAGPDAVQDLELALTDILQCFTPGSGSWLTSILSRKIDKILFAATKADHLHHENHRRLEGLTAAIVDNALKRAQFSGARVDVMAMAAVRATKEGYMGEGADKLPVVIGEPIEGEIIDGKAFDGNTQTAIFPGDLPRDPRTLLSRAKSGGALPELNFIRFRPPAIESTAEGFALSLPHIRLDRALQFLFADHLA